MPLWHRPIARNGALLREAAQALLWLGSCEVAQADRCHLFPTLLGKGRPGTNPDLHELLSAFPILLRHCLETG